VISAEDAPIGPAAALSLAGQTWTVLPDRHGIAAALAAALGACGATAIVASHDLPNRMDGLVDLSAVAPDSAGLDSEKALFDRAVRALAAGARQIVAASHAGAPFGPEQARPRSGVAGLLRSLAREQSVITRVVSLDLREPARLLAEQIVAELGSRDEHVEVAYVGGTRRALVPRRAERARGAGSGALRLGPDSVVLVTGGARGITSTVASCLARRFQCKLELVGRSAPPSGGEDADIAAAADRVAVRKAIIARGQQKNPAAIEALVGKIVGAREIGRTLRAIGEAGSPVRYHALDVRDPQALGGLIDELYARHGRIDGVIHGAGLIEDRLIADKTRDSFDRVFDTKVQPARLLLERLRPDVGFVALFSSISAVFGNKGQVDYAAANDALDKLAWWQSRRTTSRVLSVNWGPWGGGGMVSPELEREYAKRGVHLIDPAEGALAFLDELMGGSDPQVVLMNAEPEAFAARPAASNGAGQREVRVVGAPLPVRVDV
jgi:NAD(P)-dependent dehydrogenase (short-subunit alcohol dehydrogenase family)